MPSDAARSWQPIETAPKDGTRVLLAAGIHGLCIGRWHVDGWIAGWIDENGYLYPTHWMRLPEPPSPNSERKDDDAATRQQIDVDRGSERRSNEGLHPGDTGGSDTVAVSTDVRPIAPAPAESGEQIARQKLNEASIAADEAMERMSKLFPSPPDLEGVVERLRNDAELIQSLAWHDYSEDDPRTGEAFNAGGRTIINASIDMLEAASLLRNAKIMEAHHFEEYARLEAELTAMKAENERLKDARENNAWYQTALTASRQEAERLREALEKIANHVGDRGCTYDAEIARSALTHQGE